MYKYLTVCFGDLLSHCASACNACLLALIDLQFPWMPIYYLFCVICNMI
jgi:hypothetical protein